VTLGRYLGEVPTDGAGERTVEAPSAQAHRTDLAVFLVAIVIVAIAALQPLLANDMDVTTLLRVGRYSASRALIESHFQDPVLTEDAGHDGQQFYAVAVAFPDVADAQPNVDKIRYRGRRILYPALVSAFPDGRAMAWGMLGVGLVSVGAAAVAVGRLAARLGLSRWYGLAAALSPAMVESVQGSLADAPAFALALWGVVLWRRRPWPAAALFLLAALSRETTLVVPLACALVAHGRARVPPLTAVIGWVGWAAFCAWWLPATTGASSNNLFRDLFMQLELPFSEWYRQGLTSPSIVLGAALLVASVISALILRRGLPELSLWLAADLVLLVTADAGIVDRPLNFARVVPLAVPALALAVGVTRRDSRRRAAVAPTLPRAPSPPPYAVADDPAT
jgi:hypothetical protein